MSEKTGGGEEVPLAAAEEEKPRPGHLELLTPLAEWQEEWEIPSPSPTPTPTPTGKRRKRAILITGASSLLGQHLVRELLAAPPPAFTHIHTLDPIKFRTAVPQSSSSTFFNSSLKVRAYAGSLLDEAVLKRALKGASAIFHLWELTDFSLAPDEASLWRSNVEGTKKLLEVGEAAGVEYFVLASSVWVMGSATWPSVHGEEEGELPPESDLLFPIYAKTKRVAEELLFHSHIPQTAAVRVGPLFGEGDKESHVFASLKASLRAGGKLAGIGDGGGRHPVFLCWERRRRLPQPSTQDGGGGREV